MRFIEPLNLIFLLSLSFIVFLHLKKHQVKEFTVSSLNLWDEVIQELSSVKKRKFNRYLLLIIQLLIATLIVFIFSKPIWNIKSNNNNYTIVLDCSMSMKAVENGKSHFEMAKEKAIEYVKTLPVNSTITFVTMCDTTESKNEGISKFEFLNSIANIKSVYKPLDLEKATKILNTYTGKIIVFTDKNELMRYKVIKVGGNIKDLAIVYGYYDEMRNEAYCIVKNSNKHGQFSIVLKDEKNNKLDIKSFNVDGKDEEKIVFKNIPENIDLLSFIIEEEDMILENNKYIVKAGKEYKKKVLLLGNNFFIEKLMSSLPYVVFNKTDNIDSKIGEYDFYIVEKECSIKFSDNDNVWWIKPSEDMINEKLTVKGNINIVKSEFMEAVNENELYAQANCSIKSIKNSKPIMLIDDNIVMLCSDSGKGKRMYSSIDWNKSSFVLTPNFPIIMDNISKWLYEDVNDDYKKFDYVVNKSINRNDSFESKWTSVEMKNIFIILILVLLFIEWQVFKSEY